MESSQQVITVHMDSVKTPQQLVKELNANGMTYTEIASRLGCSKQLVYVMSVGHENVRYSWWLTLCQLSNNIASQQA